MNKTKLQMREHKLNHSIHIELFRKEAHHDEYMYNYCTECCQNITDCLVIKALINDRRHLCMVIIPGQGLN